MIEAVSAHTREHIVHIALLHGAYEYRAALYADNRVALARRSISGEGHRQFGAGAWVGVIIDSDTIGWPRQALDRLSAALRDRLGL